METEEERVVNVNGQKSLHSPLERSWTVDSSQPTRQDLIEMVRRAGLPVSSATTGGSYSEPSSPRKLLRRLKPSDSSTSSNTLTSEEGTVLEEEEEQETNDKGGPTIIISQDDVTDGNNDEGFRKRSGSRFYHESFSPAQNTFKPVTYIPSSKSAHQLSVSLEKKKKNIFSRIRRSFRTKHRPTSRIVSDKSTKRWIDYEEELDPVSRPSYFRHIGHVVSAGPGLIKTVQLNKPPHGKFGIYISQGIDPLGSDNKSIFVSRFYQENMSMFYASLLRPGDEILAVNGQLVRDCSVSDVSSMLVDCQTVQLTVLPFTGIQE